MVKDKQCMICGKVYSPEYVHEVTLSIKHYHSVGLESHYVAYKTFMVCSRCMDFKEDERIVRYAIKLLESKITIKLYVVTGSDGYESFAFYGVCDTEEGAKKLIEDVKSEEDYIGKWDDWFKVEYSEVELNKLIKNDGW